MCTRAGFGRLLVVEFRACACAAGGENQPAHFPMNLVQMELHRVDTWTQTRPVALHKAGETVRPADGMFKFFKL